MEVTWHDCRVALLVAEEEKRKYVGCGAGRLMHRALPALLFEFRKAIA